jgi:hypothetical protein
MENDDFAPPTAETKQITDALYDRNAAPQPLPEPPKGKFHS